MKEGDSLSRNEHISNREGSAEARSKSSVSARIQNPLIPPPQDCADAPGWWKLLASDPESRGFSVAGDLNSFSAKLTTMLVPVLLIVLILVLIADYSNPVDSARQEAPVAAGFVGEAPAEMEEDLPARQSEESVAVTTTQVSEAPAEIESPVDVVADAIVADDEVTTEVEAVDAPVVAVEKEAMEEVESEALVETIEEPQPVTVEGILYSKDNPTAIIGGRIVHVGDTVLDALVVEITKDTVLFEKTGQKWGRRVQETIATP